MRPYRFIHGVTLANVSQPDSLVRGNINKLEGKPLYVGEDREDAVGTVIEVYKDIKGYTRILGKIFMDTARGQAAYDCLCNGDFQTIGMCMKYTYAFIT
jgi:hypothetical protein